MKRRATLFRIEAGGSPSIAARGARKIGRPSKSHRAPYDIETVTNAAVRVFNRHGYEAASMEDVARETGITKSSLYHHVSGKEELLARALKRAFNGCSACSRNRAREAARRWSACAISCTAA